MNQLTIIPENGLVMIDGEAVFGLDMTSLSPDIHAVQWYGEYGEIEYKSQHGYKPENQRIYFLDDFSSVIAAFRAAQEADTAEESN